jgi:hypothetical protein
MVEMQKRRRNAASVGERRKKGYVEAMTTVAEKDEEGKRRLDFGH